MELVFNSQIPDLIKRRQVEAAEEKSRQKTLRLLDVQMAAPGLDPLQFPNRAAVHEWLKDFEEARDALEAAIENATGDSLEGPRNAVSMSRVALESVARHVTGAGDWKGATDAIRRVADDPVSRLAASVYRFLSSRGPHPGKRPSKAEGDLAVRQAIMMIQWFLANRDLFPAP